MKMYEVKCEKIPKLIEGRNLVELLEDFEIYYLRTVYAYGNKMTGKSLNELLKGCRLAEREKFKQYIAYSEEVEGYIETTVLVKMGVTNGISYVVINKPLKPLLEELKVVVKLGDKSKSELGNRHT